MLIGIWYDIAMKKRVLKEFVCKYCGAKTYSVRTGKERCTECRKKWLVEYRKREYVKQRRKDRYRENREEVIMGYGGKCECCGENRLEFLAIDHRNGGGREERKTVSIYQILRKIQDENYPKEYRVLCHNCNSALGFYGYCPHKKGKRTA